MADEQPKQSQAVNPDNLFGDKKEVIASEDAGQLEPLEQEGRPKVTPDSDKGVNYQPGEVNPEVLPRDAGAAFNVRTSTRAIPPYNPTVVTHQRDQQIRAQQEQAQQ